MKILKKIAIIFIIISCLFLYQYSYSKYREHLSGDTKVQISGWNIKVNDENIANKKQLTNKITPVFNGSEYIKENIIAPGATGYYDIIIDCSEVDVAFTYEIIAKVPDNSPFKDVIVTHYTINPELNEEKIVYEEKIKNDVSANINKIVLRLYVEWIDDETNQMSNTDDTNAVLTNKSLTINNDITFNQKKES